MNTMNCVPKKRAAFYQSPFAAFLNDDFFTRDYASYVPAVNVAEDAAAFRLEVSAPGFEKADFKVKLENSLLTISATHKEEEKSEDKNYTRREFRQGSFSRSFKVDETKVDTAAITARYENGVLFIGIPKKEAAKKENTQEIRID